MKTMEKVDSSKLPEPFAICAKELEVAFQSASRKGRNYTLLPFRKQTHYFADSFARKTHMANRIEVPAGLEGVVAYATNLSEVDGENGHLIYRGYDATYLALNYSLDAVWYLIRYGELPDADALSAFRGEVLSMMKLSPIEIKKVLAARSGEPMAQLRSAMSLVAQARGLKPWLGRDIQDVRRETLALAALIPPIIEVLRHGRAPLKKQNVSGYTEAYLWGLYGKRPTKEQIKAVGVYQILTLLHGANASTFSSRVTASTGADIGSAIVSAIGTLSGPLHGGAPGPVLDMLDAIGSIDNAKAWVTKELDEGRKIMGFGHRVYRVEDPRAHVLKQLAIELGGPKVELAVAVEAEILEQLAQRKPGRPLRTNVEFWTAIVLETAGLPRELFSTTFFSSRALAWFEEVLEQIAGNRIYRPLSRYTGPMPVFADQDEQTVPEQRAA